MANFVVSLISFLVLIVVVQSANVVRFSMEKVEEELLHKFLHEDKAPGIRRHESSKPLFSSHHPLFSHTEGNKPKQLKSFSWSNCGAPAKEEMVLESLSLSPDPVDIPGTITVSFDATFNKTVAAPLQVDLVLEKELFGVWVKVPCIDNVGSCTYPDVCSSLSKAACPTPFVQQKVPCKCPFNKGTYKLSNAAFKFSTSEPVPSGNYRITAHLSSKGAFVGCYNIEASIKG